MTTWEYLTAPVLIHNTKAILDQFGADGWELVQIIEGCLLYTSDAADE